MPATRSSSAGPRICGGCTSPARGPSSSRPRAVARRPRAATHPRGRRGPSPASPARARVRAGDRPGTRPHELNGASETACARSSINLAPTSPRSRGGHRDPPAPKAGARHAARGDRRVIRGPVGRDHTERVILDTTPLDSPARNSFRSVERASGPNLSLETRSECVGPRGARGDRASGPARYGSQSRAAVRAKCAMPPHPLWQSALAGAKRVQSRTQMRAFRPLLGRNAPASWSSVKRPTVSPVVA
jgi:hypothetical protein